MPHRLAPVAQRLRREGTSAERRLWSHLRREQVGGFKFRRQVVLGDYVVDFACYEARLIVEVDGATHSTPEEVARDERRSAALRARGYAILRFVNDEVYRNLDGVVETIHQKLSELRPRLEDANLDAPRDPPP